MAHGMARARWNGIRRQGMKLALILPLGLALAADRRRHRPAGHARDTRQLGHRRRHDHAASPCASPRTWSRSAIRAPRPPRRNDCKARGDRAAGSTRAPGSSNSTSRSPAGVSLPRPAARFGPHHRARRQRSSGNEPLRARHRRPLGSRAVHRGRHLRRHRGAPDLPRRHQRRRRPRLGRPLRLLRGRRHRREDPRRRPASATPRTQILDRHRRHRMVVASPSPMTPGCRSGFPAAGADREASSSTASSPSNAAGRCPRAARWRSSGTPASRQAGVPVPHRRARPALRP
jgi:hypothetical protein